MQSSRTAPLSPRVLTLIPLAVGINLALGQVAAATHLPLFLDTAGTVLVATLAGPWVALATALVSQVTFTIVSGNSTWLAFLPVHLIVAGYAGVAARVGVFRSPWRSAAAGAGLGAVAATASWPISYFLFGGVTAGGVTAITTLLRALGVPLEWAVLAASLSNDLLDKSVTFVLVRAILTALPRRLAAGFPDALGSAGRS